MTLAADHQNAAEVSLAHFREMMLLAFRTMTDGLPAIYRKSARTVIKFFETETDEVVWAQLRTIPDPENPMQSLADSWIAQWQQLSMAVGKEAA